ncbi:DNA methyltransferase [Cyanobacterium sp. IPPAS B-1200]|uniref:DNA methyltransferase n=1 Tax=Cyanobacterium sp. IPPAS B-1200 TaxID=1562720 RepID=UPI000A985C9E|nr:DNA methyltransferase [Cyanobacterium sp. IPPAS B-1200]
MFHQIDFQGIKNNPDFKEDSVREVIILPLLKYLGYDEKNIIRSKTLQHPFLKIGSKKRPINLIPDYVLKIENSYGWVLDAKAPSENIKTGDNIEQVYSYATHPEIRSNYFALCNGIEFSLFKTLATDTPILYFSLDQFSYYEYDLKQYLAIDRFQFGKTITYESTTATAKPKATFDYNNRPLLEPITPRKQQAKRHFGVHGYFTKQTWNVVAEYIKNYSQPNDIILDPFGGTSVTAIEALMNNRQAISIDINPMVIFWGNTLINPINLAELSDAFERVKLAYQELEPKTEKDIKKAIKKYPYPQGFVLPTGSDVDTIEKLFSDKQLAQLSLLKHIIKQEKNKYILDCLMLVFSSTINKYNLTFHYTRTDGGGDSSMFRYTRYRIAPNPGEMPLMQIYI